MMAHLIDVMVAVAGLDAGAVPQLPEWALELARCLNLCC